MTLLKALGSRFSSKDLNFLCLSLSLATSIEFLFWGEFNGSANKDRSLC